MLLSCDQISLLKMLPQKAWIWTFCNTWWWQGQYRVVNLRSWRASKSYQSCNSHQRRAMRILLCICEVTKLRELFSRNWFRNTANCCYQYLLHVFFYCKKLYWNWLYMLHAMCIYLPRTAVYWTNPKITLQTFHLNGSYHMISSEFDHFYFKV